MANETTLFCYGNDNLTLTEALTDCEALLQNGIALLYAIEQCQFAKVVGNNLLDDRDRIIPLDDFGDRYIFEARIFNSQSEVRWLNEDNGKGRSALIFDRAKFQQQAPNWQDNCSLPYLESLSQQYLLWGQSTDTVSDKGWQKLSSARIGTLTIPIEAIAKNQRVYLQTQEYLAEIDRDNPNVAVIEERLIKLEVK